MQEFFINHSTLSEMGDVIREKTNTTNLYTPQEMISTIKTTSIGSNTLDANAYQKDIVEGKIGYTNGVQIVGSIKKKEISNKTLNYSEVLTENAGYYSNISVIAPKTYGNVSSNQVMKSKTFINEQGKQIGAMNNKGVLTCSSLNLGESINSSEGYYSNIQITAKSVNLTGNAPTYKVLYPYTYYSNTGEKKTGGIRYWICTGNIMKGSKTTVNLGFHPDYVVGHCESNKTVNLNITDQSITWNINMGTYPGTIIAMNGID